MTWKPADEQEARAVGMLPWKGRQLALPANKVTERLGPLRMFGRFVVKMFYGVKGYTWNDINRLKEAGVRQVEARAAKDFAAADESIANAARAHAEAEKALAEAEAIRTKAGCERMDAQIRAVERLTSVTSQINQKGGQVAFDSEELRGLIFRISANFPEDKELRSARQDACDAGERDKLTS